MAKLTAHSKHKVAQASREYRDSDGWDHREIYALRSDGVILRKHNLRSPDMREAYGSRGWNQGGYSILAGTKNISLDRFRAWAERHNLTVKVK